MALSKAQMDILKAAYAAGSKGLMWVPGRLAWFTREGKRLRSQSVSSLASSGLLQIICPGGSASAANDFSAKIFIAVLTVAAARLVGKQS
jgi:hypothetical protein